MKPNLMQGIQSHLRLPAWLGINSQDSNLQLLTPNQSLSHFPRLPLALPFSQPSIASSQTPEREVGAWALKAGGADPSLDSQGLSGTSLFFSRTATREHLAGE